MLERNLKIFSTCIKFTQAGIEMYALNIENDTHENSTITILNGELQDALPW